MKTNKKKIYLLTYHRALSYGAVLQTYALVEILKQLDFNVEIIDFQKPFLPKAPTGLWSFKKYFGIDKLKREIIFYNFRRKYLRDKTRTFYSKKNLRSYSFAADYYIVGSDQVWNPRIAKDCLETFFFDFVEGSKIAYAASFGTEKWNENDELTEKIKNYLNDFLSISVREDSGREILKRTFNLNSETVLDPTLVWLNYSSFDKIIPFERYILYFSVNKNTQVFNKVSEYAVQCNLPLIVLAQKVYNSNVKCISYPSVEEWMMYLKHANVVFTDSFHGVAFSLIFENDFWVFNTNPERFTRIQSLLSKLRLTNRIIDSDLIFNSEINLVNYKSVNKLLDEMRINSINFLTRSLK